MPLDEEIILLTKAWLEKCVIGLNLCPFAKPVYTSGRIGFSVSRATSEKMLLIDLHLELGKLANAKLEELETTLLIHPDVLSDFLDYNDFLGSAEEAVTKLGLDGTLQIASFHPNYQFAGRRADDMSNYTNRSPYQMLHLLREDSIEHAVDAYPDIDQIYERNMRTMRKLGLDGWNALK